MMNVDGKRRSVLLCSLFFILVVKFWVRHLFSRMWFSETSLDSTATKLFVLAFDERELAFVSTNDPLGSLDCQQSFTSVANNNNNSNNDNYQNENSLAFGTNNYKKNYIMDINRIKENKILDIQKYYVYDEEVFLYMKDLYHQGMHLIGRQDLHTGLVHLRNAVRESKYIFKEDFTTETRVHVLHSYFQEREQWNSSFCIESRIDKSNHIVNNSNENISLLRYDKANMLNTSFLEENIHGELKRSFNVVVDIVLLMNDLGVTEMRLGLLEKAYSQFSHGKSIINCLRSKIELSEGRKYDLNTEISKMMNILESLTDNYKDLVHYIKAQSKRQQTYGKEEANEIDFSILLHSCKKINRKHKKIYEGILSSMADYQESSNLLQKYNDLSIIRNILIKYTHKERKKTNEKIHNVDEENNANRGHGKLLPIAKYCIYEEYEKYVKRYEKQESDKKLKEKERSYEQGKDSNEIKTVRKTTQVRPPPSKFMSFFLQEILDWKNPFILTFHRQNQTYLDEDQSYRNYHSDFIQYLIDTYNDVPVDYYPHGLQEVGNSPIFLGLKEASLQLLRAPKEREDNVEDALMYSEKHKDIPHVQQYKVKEALETLPRSNFMHNLYKYQLDPFIYDISRKGSYIQWNLPQKTYIGLINYIFSKNQENSDNMYEHWIESLFFHEFLSKHSENWLPYCFPNSAVSPNFNSSIDFLENYLKQSKSFQRFTEYINESVVSDFGIGSHWWMLLIGEENAGMFIHTDTLRTSSWQYQIQGVKEWRLCSPRAFNNSLYLPSIHSGKAGFVDAFEYYETDSPRKNEHPNDKKKVSIEKQLNNFEHVTCYGASIAPQELLYYPRDYWHQTTCRSTPSIALSGSILDPFLGIHEKFDTLNQKKKMKKRKADWKLVFSELMRECNMYITSAGDQSNSNLREKPRVFFGNEEVCQRLQYCGQKILPFIGQN